MTANFFQNLNSRGVEYLLISGQATVLYGAATFSEDIDLWINPTLLNREKFLDVLRSTGARFYKLTPSFTLENLERGHGFHFILPGESMNEIFLDVMGSPPRVNSFGAAVDSAHWIETQWGKIHTISLKGLVELKKTQRLEDYPIISNLALAWFDQPECANTWVDFDWAMENIFTLTALRTFFEEHSGALEFATTGAAADLKIFSQHVAQDRPAPEETEEKLTVSMQRRIAVLQHADRAYWREIIAELKQFRAEGKLMSEGDRV
jgi:hypothetical protein